MVLRGEAGVGKTALLEYASERASGCRIARAAGVQSEMELAFSGLHQLCAPMLTGLEQLPGPQRDALRVAFGLEVGGAPDPFLVALAVLSLLAEAAESGPLVCVVDDAQWLDRASTQALAFVARRLLAERIVMLFAVRAPTDEGVLEGLPELVVEGITNGDARLLLASGMPGPLDERVRDRILAETRGNPLAILELPRGLTPAELAGGFGLPNTGTLGDRIEQSFIRRLESLPPDAQRLLLTAAAEPVGDVTLLWRAAQELGIPSDAITPAEGAGLIEIGSRVRFRHPLVRSAVYRAASVPDRQEVHRALADATDPEADPDRRAWHRAHAAAGLDEEVAAELERSAGRAQARGGVAAAAAFLERAAELTPDPNRRGTRALAAAEAKLMAGAPDAAHALLATAELAPLDELERARLQRLRARIAFALRRGSDAPPLLLDAAKRLAPLDAGLARETCLEGLAAAIFTRRLGDSGNAIEVVRATQASPPGPLAIDSLLDGLAAWNTAGYAASVPQLRDALDAFRRDAGNAAANRWLWLACRIAADLWDNETWHELATRGVQLARDSGALSLLPLAASFRAGLHVHAGEFDAASALMDEARAVNDATGNAPLLYVPLVLACWRGQEIQALGLIEAGRRNANDRGQHFALSMIEAANALLFNGLGRYDQALAVAGPACEQEESALFPFALVEMIEAAARSHRPHLAATALERLSERTRASGSEWALGIEARSRALLADGPAAHALYQEAVERLADCRLAPHLARAQLLFGEWLRREHRRVDARVQLRAAHDLFSGIGADAFAERARIELLATGETARIRTVDTRDALTPQETQVARLASDGRTNPEIGAQLFISPRTVEYHLHKVFGKLSISSRRELGPALAAVGSPSGDGG